MCQHRGWIGARLATRQQVGEVGLWRLGSKSAKVEGERREKMRESKERGRATGRMTEREGK